MTYPAVTATAERWYGLLPAYLRAADANEPSGGGYPLLRWISLIADQFDPVAELVTRFTPALNGGHCDLWEPARADAAWLPWLAVQQGVDPTITDVAALRSAITAAPTTWAEAGTLGPIVAGVQALLTGTQWVQVLADSQWRLTLHTKPSETPDPALILPALSGLIPAWLEVLHQVGSGPWSDLETDFPGGETGTWADLAGGGDDTGGVLYGTRQYGTFLYGGGAGTPDWDFLATWEPDTTTIPEE